MQIKILKIIKYSHQEAVIWDKLKAKWNVFSTNYMPNAYICNKNKNLTFNYHGRIKSKQGDPLNWEFHTNVMINECDESVTC